MSSPTEDPVVIPTPVQPGTKHALTNMPNWLTLATFIGGLTPVLLANSWVQSHADWVIGLTLTGVVTSYVGQFLRDKTGSAVSMTPVQTDPKI